MARIKPGHLGTPQGKSGNLIYRKRGKKIVAYQLNEAYRKSSSEKVKINQERFTELSNICNFINQNKIVKKLLKFSEIKGTYTNLKLFKLNYDNFRDWGVTSSFSILPLNFSFKKVNAEIEDDKIHLSFSKPLRFIDFKKQSGELLPPFHIMAVVHAEDPVDSTIKKTKNFMLGEFVESFEFNNEGLSNFTLIDDRFDSSVLNSYNTVLVFLAIISEEENGAVYKWAASSGVYIKGSKPAFKRYNPEPVPAPPKKIFFKD